MKIQTFTRKAALALLVLAPVIIAGKLKENFTAPVLPTITYYLPEDLHMASHKAVLNHLYERMQLQEAGLDKKVLEVAMEGFKNLSRKGKLTRDSILTIVDFSQSSKQKRLYVIDIKNGELLFNTHVAHGRKSGMEYANSFSNVVASNKSSLGFYITDKTYRGENGYSLRLKGLERNINDKAYGRAIVVHGAKYASESFLNAHGILGRSFGCPAIPMEEHTEIIDAIKDGSCLFIYSPDAKYIKQSTVLNS